MKEYRARRQSKLDPFRLQILHAYLVKGWSLERIRTHIIKETPCTRSTILRFIRRALEA